MENRDRDKMSRNQQPTDAGKVNRDTSQNESDSDLEFGEKIGRSENPESEPSRRDENRGSGMTGRAMTGSNSGREH
jgi:hypothetical protein